MSYHIKLLGLASLFVLTSCGGGGGDSSENSSSTTNNGIPFLGGLYQYKYDLFGNTCPTSVPSHLEGLQAVNQDQLNIVITHNPTNPDPVVISGQLNSKQNGFDVKKEEASSANCVNTTRIIYDFTNDPSEDFSSILGFKTECANSGLSCETVWSGGVKFIRNLEAGE